MVESLYGSYLKSDIIQVAHHGGPGATLKLNQAIDADMIPLPFDPELVETWELLGQE